MDGLRTYLYRFDTDELAVEVVRGGHVGDMYKVTSTLYGVDIVLDQPLASGEKALMHYRTTFFYRHAAADRVPPRRDGHDEGRHRWGCSSTRTRCRPGCGRGRWDRADHATVIEQQLVELDGESSVQIRYDKVEDAIVGFHWSWD